MELPELCNAAILCRTTPLDVVRLSVVSKTFHSAADSDMIWDHFLPSDYQSIISHAPSLANAPSKKALYLALSDHPIIMDQGKKSFQLDKKSGKKCYMLAARALSIVKGDERYWHWVSNPESRFREVALIQPLCWFEFHGKINTIDLSSNTLYAAFLVFKLVDGHGLHHCLADLIISGVPYSSKKVCLDPERAKERRPDGIKGPECPKMRSDGFLEIEIAEFFNSSLKHDEVEMRVTTVKMRRCLGTLCLEGIEVRPKISNPRKNSS